MKFVTKEDIITIQKCLFGIKPNSKTVASEFYNFRKLTAEEYYWEKSVTPNAINHEIETAMKQHLLQIHKARVKLVCTILPPAKTIVDLGGANGSIYAMGYPYKFRDITVVDLLPDERDPMYKNINLKPTRTPNGNIKIHYGDMSDLSFIKDNKIDLVWSGESIEHVPENVGVKTIQEAYRILKPGGYFCLDTPNGKITKIHTGGGFIHPEHKVEYSAKHLQRMLVQAGFKIQKKLGLREMPNTIKNKKIDYTDFIHGNTLSSKPEQCYIQYYECVKPLKFSVNANIKKISRVANSVRKNRDTNKGN